MFILPTNAATTNANARMETDIGPSRNESAMQAQTVLAARRFESLKTKQRRLRGGFSEAVGLRVHRAISWFGRAMAETDDPAKSETGNGS